MLTVQSDFNVEWWLPLETAWCKSSVHFLAKFQKGSSVLLLAGTGILRSQYNEKQPNSFPITSGLHSCLTLTLKLTGIVVGILILPFCNMVAMAMLVAAMKAPCTEHLFSLQFLTSIEMASLCKTFVRMQVFLIILGSCKLVGGKTPANWCLGLPMILFNIRAKIDLTARNTFSSRERVRWPLIISVREGLKGGVFNSNFSSQSWELFLCLVFKKSKKSLERLRREVSSAMRWCTVKTRVLLYDPQ